MNFKNNVSYWKKLTISAAGCLIIGIGIGICEHAQLGTDPMTVLLVGLYNHMNLGLGTINMLLSLA